MTRWLFSGSVDAPSHATGLDIYEALQLALGKYWTEFTVDIDGAKKVQP